MSTIFLLVTLFFGWSFTVLILGEKRLHVILPITIIVGINGYNLFLNIFSYFLPINTSIWFVGAIMLIFDLLAALIFAKKLRSIERSLFSSKRQIILFSVAIFISLLSTLVAVKSLALDDLFIGHIPLAHTIAAGNFPVMDPTSPDRVLSYHYAPDLLAAAINIITGMPIWLAYDFQVFLFTGSFFLLLFVLVYEISNSYWPAIISAFSFVYGFGLEWLYFFGRGLPTLWHKYILHEDVLYPWKFLADMAFPKLNTAYFFGLNNHTVAMGMPVLFLAIYLFVKAIKETNGKKAYLLALTAGIFYGYGALILETYWVIIFIAFVVLALVFFVGKKWPPLKDFTAFIKTRNFFALTAVVLVAGLFMAFLQGGVLSALLHDSDREPLTLVKSWADFAILNLAPNPAMADNSDTFIRLFSFDFFVQFGLPLLLIIPALYYFWKKAKGEELFIGLMGVGAFVIPFIFRLPTRPWEVSRFFTFAMPVFSLLAALYLCFKYQEVLTKKAKVFVAVMLVLISISGIASQTMFAITSLDSFGKIKPLVKKPSEPNSLEQKAVDWIMASTTQNDRFFPYDPDFVRWTGRFTPGYFAYFTFNLRQKEKAAYAAMTDSCDKSGFQFFGVNYLYVTPSFPIKDKEACFRTLGAKEVFASGNGDKAVKIYKIGFDL